MKTINLTIVYIILAGVLLTNNNVIAQIGIGTTGPDDSSMLDIVSTAKGVLIPRMTTTERNAIVLPASSLLVFDTTSNSFWFNNGDATTPVWKELVSGSSIVDANGDTKIEAEQSTDEDKIHFSTANVAKDASVERMTIDNSGKILIGTDLSAQATTFFEMDTDGTIKLGNKGGSTTPDSDTNTEENYTKITADGSLSYVGNATRWDDLKVPVNSVKIKNIADEATFEDFYGGLLALKFKDDKDRSVFFTVQMPHAWKEGTNIFPHVHWSVQTAIGSPDTAGVIWGLRYRWANVAENFDDVTVTNITGQAIANPNKVNGVEAYEHVITPLGSGGIGATDKTLSSMLICELYRDVSDTYAGDDVFLLEIDFHYQIDSDGSNQEYTKE